MKPDGHDQTLNSAAEMDRFLPDIELQHCANNVVHHNVAPQPASNEDTMNTSLGPHSDDSQPHSDTFCHMYAERNNTKLKSLLPNSSASEKKLVFLVHVNETDHIFKLVLSNFANVIRDLSGVDVTVKLDFECLEENQKDIKMWAEGILKACTNIVIVLSESFTKICSSYLGSRTMEVNSGCAYRDIAPLVMEHLRNESGFGRAIFVHFGLAAAEDDYQQLLQLYHSPPRHLLQGEPSPNLCSGQPASTPALPIHDRNIPAVLPPGQAVVSNAQSGSITQHSSVVSFGVVPGACSGSAHSSSDHCSPEPFPGKTPPPYSWDITSGGGSVFCNVQGHCHVDSNGLASAGSPCQIREVFRHRYPSAPQEEASSAHNSCLSTRGRHQSAPGWSPLSPPPYEAACTTPCSSCPQTAQHPHPSLPCGNGNFHIVESSVDSQYQPSHLADPSAPLLNSGGEPAVSHLRSQGPKLIPLRRPEDLKVFLRELCLCEQSIDEATQGRHTEALFHEIEKRFNDQNPREPVQHSCYSSPAGSQTNIAEAH